MAWRDRDRNGLPPFFAIADPELLARRADHLGLTIPLQSITQGAQATQCFAHALPVLPVSFGAETAPGKPDHALTPSIIGVIEEAVGRIMRGEASALVTNPVSKAVLQAGGFTFPGHTEFLCSLAHKWDAGARPAMMLVGAGLRVVPVTIHIPLKDVPAHLNTEGVQRTAQIVAQALERDFGIAEPRIAVAGLNPHAGEDGTIGREEIEIITPAIAALRENGINASGPHPADTLFHARARQTYDAALAMYHDQALIPVKTLAFDEGVNATLGLPFVRTSPDHGTAFDLAGTGRALPGSLINAIKLAHNMAAARMRHSQEAR